MSTNGNAIVPCVLALSLQISGSPFSHTIAQADLDHHSVIGAHSACVGHIAPRHGINVDRGKFEYDEAGRVFFNESPDGTHDGFEVIGDFLKLIDSEQCGKDMACADSDTTPWDPLAATAAQMVLQNERAMEEPATLSIDDTAREILGKTADLRLLLPIEGATRRGPAGCSVPSSKAEAAVKEALQRLKWMHGGQLEGREEDSATEEKRLFFTSAAAALRLPLLAEDIYHGLRPQLVKTAVDILNGNGPSGAHSVSIPSGRMVALALASFVAGLNGNRFPLPWHRLLWQPMESQTARGLMLALCLFSGWRAPLEVTNGIIAADTLACNSVGCMMRKCFRSSFDTHQAYRGPGQGKFGGYAVLSAVGLSGFVEKPTKAAMLMKNATAGLARCRHSKLPSREEKEQRKRAGDALFGHAAAFATAASVYVNLLSGTPPSLSLRAGESSAGSTPGSTPGRKRAAPRPTAGTPLKTDEGQGGLKASKSWTTARATNPTPRQAGGSFRCRPDFPPLLRVERFLLCSQPAVVEAPERFPGTANDLNLLQASNTELTQIPPRPDVRHCGAMRMHVTPIVTPEGTWLAATLPTESEGESQSVRTASLPAMHLASVSPTPTTKKASVLWTIGKRVLAGAMNAANP